MNSFTLTSVGERGGKRKTHIPRESERGQTNRREAGGESEGRGKVEEKRNRRKRGEKKQILVSSFPCMVRVLLFFPVF